MGIPYKLSALTLCVLGVSSLPAYAEGEMARQVEMTCYVKEESQEPSRRTGHSYLSAPFFVLAPTDPDKLKAAKTEIENAFQRYFQRYVGLPSEWTECDVWDTASGYTVEKYFASARIGNKINSDHPWLGLTIFTEWTPSEELRQRIKRRFISISNQEEHTSEDEGEEEIFGPKAEKALNAWRDKHRIEDRGAIAKTLMLMVQTALALHGFDPGAADGVLGKRTLAAIVAWQTMQGFPEGAELAGLIAAILRAALVLEGYDPGPVEEMLGSTAIKAVRAWAPSYEKAARNQGSRDRVDRLSPPTSWRTVPHAKDCVSVVRSGGAGNYQFIRNTCDFKIDVHWCYTDRPGDNDYCAPGRAGIGYMDRVGHKATRRGAGPDYYADSDGLRARETSPKRLRRGAIRYIACGHRPLRNAQQYVTEWDAHTAKFRCLAYAPEQDDRTPAEGTAE